MKNKNFLIAFSVLLLAMLACNTLLPSTESPTLPTVSVQQPQNNNAPLTENDVPRIPVDEAKAAFDSGQAIIVDVRSAQNYAESHATGSISIPLDSFELNINSVPLEKSQWIITYCT